MSRYTAENPPQTGDENPEKLVMSRYTAEKPLRTGDIVTVDENPEKIIVTRYTAEKLPLSRYTAENPPQTGDIVTVDENPYYVGDSSGNRYAAAEFLRTTKAGYKWVVKVQDAYPWPDSIVHYILYPFLDRTPSANEGYFVAPECMNLVVRLENPMGTE